MWVGKFIKTIADSQLPRMLELIGENYGRGFMNANATSFGSGTANTFGSTSVVRAPTAAAAVTVHMFHANEPGAQGAFEAAQILKQYSW